MDLRFLLIISVLLIVLNDSIEMTPMPVDDLASSSIVKFRPKGIDYYPTSQFIRRICQLKKQSESTLRFCSSFSNWLNSIKDNQDGEREKRIGWTISVWLKQSKINDCSFSKYFFFFCCLIFELKKQRPSWDKEICSHGLATRLPPTKYRWCGVKQTGRLISIIANRWCWWCFSESGLVVQEIRKPLNMHKCHRSFRLSLRNVRPVRQ